MICAACRKTLRSTAEVRAGRRAAAQAVALDLVAQEGMDLVNHRPAVLSTGRIGTGRTAVMLGVDHVERELRGDPLQAASGQPAGRRDGVDRRTLEILHRVSPAPAGWSRKCATTTSTPRGLRAPQDLDRQHRRAVVLAGDRERRDHQNAHRIRLHPSWGHVEPQDSGSMSVSQTPVPHELAVRFRSRSASDGPRGPARGDGAGRGRGRRPCGGRGPRWRRRGCPGRCRGGAAAGHRGRAAGRCGDR